MASRKTTTKQPSASVRAKPAARKAGGRKAAPKAAEAGPAGLAKARFGKDRIVKDISELTALVTALGRKEVGKGLKHVEDIISRYVSQETRSAEIRTAMKPGPNVFNRIHVKNHRGTPFCGCAVITGSGRNARSQMHATTGISVATPETPDMIDTKRLAKELGVDLCAVNRGRIWTVDELEVQGGYLVDFHGVKMSWVGEMVAEDLFLQFQNPYLPSLIKRYTNWIYYSGKPVHLLREPGGPVWVMQEYTKGVDPGLEIDNLHEVGRKLKNLPKGWKFETKVLTRELSLDTMRGDGWASIIRDELGCTYQACGYGADTSANYVP